MFEFKIGDLVEFIPENFDTAIWPFRLIGFGFIESITANEDYSTKRVYKFYHVYCGKITKQQVKNFVEMEMTDRTFKLSETEIKKICRKINL